MYKLNERITVRDDVTMITIENVSDDKSVMANILKEISKMEMSIDVLDYHNSYKGSRLTVLVENSGILRVTGAVGMFRDKTDGIICNVYCLNTAITVNVKSHPISDVARIMEALENDKTEIYYLFSHLSGITVVINEAYTDSVCKCLDKLFQN